MAEQSQQLQRRYTVRQVTEYQASWVEQQRGEEGRFTIQLTNLDLGINPCGTKPMPMDAGQIERLIKTALPDAEIEIRDLAGDGDHYAATVVSPAFAGKSRVQQHQMVYAALQGNMGGALHALALQTSAPK